LAKYKESAISIELAYCKQACLLQAGLPAMHRAGKLRADGLKLVVCRLRGRLCLDGLLPDTSYGSSFILRFPANLFSTLPEQRPGYQLADAATQASYSRMHKFKEIIS